MENINFRVYNLFLILRHRHQRKHIFWYKFKIFFRPKKGQQTGPKDHSIIFAYYYFVKDKLNDGIFWRSIFASTSQ